jgi:muconolactone delta-isomerase
VPEPVQASPEPGARDGRHPVTPSPMRRAIARRMVESKGSAPHFYLSTEIEMDALLAGAARANWGVWEAQDATALHAAIGSLPFFPYLEVEVIPLAAHPTDPERPGGR